MAGAAAGSGDLMWIEPVNSGRHWYNVTVMPGVAIERPDLRVGVARMRKEILDVGNLELRDAF